MLKKMLDIHILKRCRDVDIPLMSVRLPPGWSRLYPDFSKIFSEASECEKQGLFTIAGTGYRKALEFLVKDYLQKEQNLTKEAIGECRLEKCCQKIEFEPIQKLANAATWLGNDETHYVVKHPEYDIDQMKSFLYALISSIHNKYELEKAEELLNEKSCHRNTAGKTGFLRQLFSLLKELYNDNHDPDDHVESHSNV